MTDPIDVGMSPIEHMRAMNELFPTTTTAAALAAMEEVVRLRTAIENASHAPGCRIREFYTKGNGPKPCTCWKAGVL